MARVYESSIFSRSYSAFSNIEWRLEAFATHNGSAGGKTSTNDVINFARSQMGGLRVGRA